MMMHILCFGGTDFGFAYRHSFFTLSLHVEFCLSLSIFTKVCIAAIMYYCSHIYCFFTLYSSMILFSCLWSELINLIAISHVYCRFVLAINTGLCFFQFAS